MRTFKEIENENRGHNVTVNLETRTPMGGGEITIWGKDCDWKAQAFINAGCPHTIKPHPRYEGVKTVIFEPCPCAIILDWGVHPDERVETVIYCLA